ncbi:hypothetical protein CE91St41_31150 [Oscillospiraceae bacterium]|nr:hypothetical protein CE91St40_31150 [Oscillospiraceae bacterium]BDF76226.1 hypothetical protein CE91St41_31150 [Oscillospiraceae bacterium]
MKRRNVAQLAILLVLGLGVLFSLMAFDQPGGRETELLEVSVIIREADSTGWSAARQGMEQAAADLGAELRFLTLSRANSVEEQRTLLEREVEGGADAVVLVPADPEALSGDVAQAAGSTKIVTMESDMARDGASACITVDNAALGRVLGQAALNGVEEGGEVLLVNSAPGSAGVDLRLDEAARVLEEAGRSSSVCMASEGVDLAQTLERTLRARRPDAVLAFEPAALEQAARLSQALERPPLIYGAGATGAVASYLERGNITLIAAQNEFTAGYLAVQAAVRAARGAVLPPVAPLAFSVIRQEDMYDTDNQKLLFPMTR